VPAAEAREEGWCLAEEERETATEVAEVAFADSPLDSLAERTEVEEMVPGWTAAGGLEARSVVAGSGGTREVGTPAATLRRSRWKGLE
jgi:hypothetical protein